MPWISAASALGWKPLSSGHGSSALLKPRNVEVSESFSPKTAAVLHQNFLQLDQGLNRDPEPRGDNSAAAQGEQEVGKAGAPGVKCRVRAPASHPRAGRGQEAP